MIMKIDGIKFILAIAIAFLLGFICEIIAPESESRNWISLAVGFVSIASVMIPAMGVKYANVNRGVNLKVFSWVMVVVIAVANLIFSCFEYKIDIYIAIVLLLAVVAWGIIYGMFSAKSAQK